MDCLKTEFNATKVNEKLTNSRHRGKCKEDIYLELGKFIEVVVKDNDASKVNIQSFYQWLKPAILHNQYAFLKQEGDIDYSGYILWAWVDEQILDDYMTKDRFSIHPSSWNEGNKLIVIDFLILGLPLPVMLKLFREARKQIGLSIKDINICLRNNDGMVKRTNKRQRYGI